MDLFQRIKQFIKPSYFVVKHSTESPSANSFCYPAQTLVLTAYRKEQRVGQIKGSLAPSKQFNRFYIYNIETEPNFRRSGVATRLLQEMQLLAQTSMTPVHETSSSHSFWQAMRDRQLSLGIQLNHTIYIDEMETEKTRWNE